MSGLEPRSSVAIGWWSLALSQRLLLPFAGDLWGTGLLLEPASRLLAVSFTRS